MAMITNSHCPENRTLYNFSKRFLSSVTCNIVVTTNSIHARQHSIPAFHCALNFLFFPSFHQSSPRFMAIKKWYIWIFIDIIDLLLFNFCDKLSFSPGSDNNSEQRQTLKKMEEEKIFQEMKYCGSHVEDYRVHRLINHARKLLSCAREKNWKTKKTTTNFFSLTLWIQRRFIERLEFLLWMERIVQTRLVII